jgi:hypothetical protein
MDWRSVDLDTFREALTDEDVRFAALAHFGAAAFLALAGAAVVAVTMDCDTSHGSPFTAIAMTVANAFAAVVLLGVGAALPIVLMKFRPRSPDHGRAAVLLVQNIVLARVLLRGFMGVVGLLACLGIGVAGFLRPYPLFWLNSTTAVIAAVTLLASVPDRERLVDLFRALTGSGGGSQQ